MNIACENAQIPIRQINFIKVELNIRAIVQNLLVRVWFRSIGWFQPFRGLVLCNLP